MSFSIVDLLKVRVGWEQPYNGGSPVTAYQILFLHADGVSFSTIDAYCDGTQISILLQRYCDVPFTVLREAPISLGFNDLVQVKIYATNSIGDGPENSVNIEGVHI